MFGTLVHDLAVEYPLAGQTVVGLYGVPQGEYTVRTAPGGQRQTAHAGTLPLVRGDPFRKTRLPCVHVHESHTEIEVVTDILRTDSHNTGEKNQDSWNFGSESGKHDSTQIKREVLEAGLEPAQPVKAKGF